MPSMSAHVPYGVGETTRAAAASGYRRHMSCTCCGDGGCATCNCWSQRGRIQRGCNPEKINPAVTDSWASRLTSSSPDTPATASIAAFTDRELPQVEKNACSAPTAAAINSSACFK